jgi:hypothetical protein
MISLHSFKPNYFSFFRGGALVCQVCGLDREADTHPKTLKPALQTIRGMLQTINWGPRPILTQNQVSAAIERECRRLGTEYQWMGRARDREYLSCTRDQLIQTVIDHYFNPFPYKPLLPAFEQEDEDCDEKAFWGILWGAWCKITAVAYVEDYGSKHAYNIFIHPDLSVTFFDPGRVHFPNPPEGALFQFKEQVFIKI